MKLALLCTLLATSAPDKPRATLRMLSPRHGLAIAQPGRSVTVMVRVAWEDEQGRHNCPTFALDWVNGHSGWEPHCDPFAPYGDPIRIVWDPRPIQFWGPGEYDLKATVTSQGEKYRASARFTVAGAR